MLTSWDTLLLLMHDWNLYDLQMQHSNINEIMLHNVACNIRQLLWVCRRR